MRKVAPFVVAALALVACQDLDPAPPPACSTPAGAVTVVSSASSRASASAAKPSTGSTPAARRPSRPPEVVDPDPMTLAPFARELIPRIACAKPVAPGRRLPPGASKRVKGLYASCVGAIGKPAPEGTNEGLEKCALLAETLMAGYGAPENALLATQLDARACALGGMRACRGLASASFEGLGLAFDPTCGAEVLGDACERHDAESCALLGQRIVGGDLVAIDPIGGEAMLQRACDQGAFHGCLWLANAIPAAEEPRRTALFERAASLAEPACQCGDAAACGELHWAYRGNFRGGGFGEAFRQAHADQAKSDAFGAMACALGEPHACHGGGDADGLTKACDDGDAERCIDLVFAGPHGSGNPLRPEDVKHLEGACRGGSSRGCWALGDSHPAARHDACLEGELGACRPDGRGSPMPTRSDADRKQGCDQGLAIDCRELGEAAAKAGRDEEALRLFERACPSVRSRRDSRDIDSIACAEAGRRYRKRGASLDQERAIELLLVGCFAEGRTNPRGEGCADLADMIDKGEGTPPDADRATAIYAGLCAAQPNQCDAVKARLGSEFSPGRGFE